MGGALCGPGLYINPVIPSERNRRMTILSLIARRYKVVELKGTFWNLGRAYRVGVAVAPG